MQAVIKYFYLKETMLRKIFCDMKKTSGLSSGLSSTAYATVAKWHAEFKQMEIDVR